MAYRLRVYAPTGSGINTLFVYDGSGNYLAASAPQGTSTPCIDLTNINQTIYVSAELSSGVSVSQWVVKIDGSTQSKTTDTCALEWSYPITSASNIYVRLEVGGASGGDVYYAQLAFNANEGSNAPSTLSNSSNTGMYVRFNIPSTIPVREGYVFDGWQLEGEGTYYNYPGYIDLWGTTTYPGKLHTLVAHWTLATQSGDVWIYVGGSWKKATPYIYKSGWIQATPYLYNGSWQLI